MTSFKDDTVDFRRRMYAMGEELGTTAREWYSMVKPGGIYADKLDDSDHISPFDIGAKRSFVPALGDILWEIPRELEKIAYYAYVCQLNDDRKLGYVRVPNYDYNTETVDVFEEIIGRFESTTSAMVLDQVNNGGGSLFHMYSILSLLTDRPLTLPKHQITISEDLAAVAADVLADAMSGESVPSDERPPPELVNYYRFVLSEKAAGRGTGDRPTSPVFLNGIAEILPAKTHYTKPIVVLINELDFSASEFLAAVLQDNKKAVLFGQRTAGAGGCVKRITPPNSQLFGIDFITVTWTLAWRTNGQPIENIGVHPDIEYHPTVEDLQSHFAGYRRALLSCLRT
jgi:hypothetical protein